MAGGSCRKGRAFVERMLVSSPSSLGVPELSVHSITAKLGDTAGGLLFKFHCLPFLSTTWKRSCLHRSGVRKAPLSRNVSLKLFVVCFKITSTHTV